ncbi:MAG TPA: glycerol-3-phosphate dehydrogenase, partial [Afifellaceae bacterium]|nr:glycerol-3-phosphate dehydrogenase [Afifellaceae bacterium]
QDQDSGKTHEIGARLIVNAAGPWVDDILRGPAGRNGAHNVRLVQGSHIVVPKLFEHDDCYIFQNEDGRIIFAIPYEQDYTLIGTTDHDYEGDPGAVRITDTEKAYLCEAASEYFTQPIGVDDIVWAYSGVRPLFDDGASKAQEATRDYVLKEDVRDGAPMINIFGGKITTYRRLAESVLEKIEALIGSKGEPWTAEATLPGGDFPMTGYDDLVAGLQRDFPFLADKLARRLARAYGTDARSILDEAKCLDDLGEMFGTDLSEAEVNWLVGEEWARTADDILWRRSKLGLRFSSDEASALAAWLASTGKPSSQSAAGQA